MTKADRQKVFNKYGGKCAYCGCELEKGWHLDHVEPVCRIYEDELVTKTKKNHAGEEYSFKEHVTKYKGMAYAHLDTVENALPSCASCNINKHGDSIEGFRSSIKGYLNSLNLRMVQYKMVKKYGLVKETGIDVMFYFETLNSNKNAEECDATEAK